MRKKFLVLNARKDWHRPDRAHHRPSVRMAWVGLRVLYILSGSGLLSSVLVEKKLLQVKTWLDCVGLWMIVRSDCGSLRFLSRNVFGLRPGSRFFAILRDSSQFTALWRATYWWFRLQELEAGQMGYCVQVWRRVLSCHSKCGCLFIHIEGLHHVYSCFLLQFMVGFQSLSFRTAVGPQTLLPWILFWPLAVALQLGGASYLLGPHPMVVWRLVDISLNTWGDFGRIVQTKQLLVRN